MAPEGPPPPPKVRYLLGADYIYLGVADAASPLSQVAPQPANPVEACFLVFQTRHLTCHCRFNATRYNVTGPGLNMTGKVRPIGGGRKLQEEEDAAGGCGRRLQEEEDAEGGCGRRLQEDASKTTK